MSRFVQYVAFASAAIVLAAGIPAIGGGQPRLPYHGVPRDIDFIKNAGWTQVIVQGPGPDSLVSQTTNDHIQSILLVALMLKSEVMVNGVEDTPRPIKLTSVSLSVNAKQEQGQVLALSFDEKDNYFRATIIDQQKKVNVWTKSARLQGIVEAAVRQSIPVQEFTFDAKTMEITRGKVNISLRKN